MATPELDPCPDSPNCVSSDATDEGHHVAPFLIASGRDDLWHAVAQILGGMPRTRVVEHSDTYLRAEARSAVFRFVDDVELELRQQDGVIAVRSASRVGHSDLGANRRRVEGLRGRLVEAGLAGR